MSAAKHTPGPWHVMKGPDAFIRSESGDNIARICVYGPTSETPRAERENARLIAAAPELLEALAEIVLYHTTSKPWPYQEGDMSHWVKKARAAIAKATGETK